MENNYPSDLNTIKILFLISGIVNAITILIWIVSSPAVIFGTCGLGCFLYILPVINILSGVYDFMAYSRINNINRTGTLSFLKTAAVMEIISIISGNLVSLTFGIINLVLLGKPEISSYLKEKGAE